MESKTRVELASLIFDAVEIATDEAQRGESTLRDRVAELAKEGFRGI